MTDKQAFVQFVESLMVGREVPEQVLKYFNNLKNRPEKAKPQFTENGKIVLEFLKNHADGQFTSKTIADGTVLSPRAVSGSIRKLVTDGYVQKIEGGTTLEYAITPSGVSANIEA